MQPAKEEEDNKGWKEKLKAHEEKDEVMFR